jgi:hypothetical protein
MMKKFNNFLLGVAAVVTVVAPLVPKNLYVTINSEPTHTTNKSKLVISQCDLAYTSVTSTGMQVCEYHCREGNKATIYKTFRSNAVSCSDTTTEKVQQSKK